MASVLDVFDLLTATFAATEFDLRKDWEARYKRLAEHKVLLSVVDLRRTGRRA